MIAPHKQDTPWRHSPSPPQLGRAITSRLQRRGLDGGQEYFSGALALIAVGSQGRHEQTLFTDQDYLFFHGDSAAENAEYGDTASEYFGTLGSIFVKILEETGIRKCRSGIRPDNDEWRGSPEEWRQRLVMTARFQHDDWAKSILKLIILTDARHIAGDRELGNRFAPFVRAQINKNFQTIRSMARVAGAMRLPNGFIRRFAVEAVGPDKGSFNLDDDDYINPYELAVGERGTVQSNHENR